MLNARIPGGYVVKDATLTPRAEEARHNPHRGILFFRSYVCPGFVLMAYREFNYSQHKQD